MYNLAKGMTALAAIAFLLAVVSNFSGPILATSAEGLSRASSNLALLAIAWAVVFGSRSFASAPRS
jgi:hypothetical protein